MKCDVDSIHNDDLGSVVGNFHGEPIREWFRKESEERDSRRSRLDLLTKAPGDSVPSIQMTEELATGQYFICADNILRRKTTAEAIGYDQYHNSALNAEGRRVTIAEALVLSVEGAYINWRPDGNCGPDAYALVVGEVEGMDPVIEVPVELLAATIPAMQATL